MNLFTFVRSSIVLGAVVAIAACAGSNPTSPSQPASTTAALSSSASDGIQGNSGSVQSGSAAFNLVPVGSTFGFAAVPGGRSVQLSGDIVGTNFEPGTCHPGVDSVAGLSCVFFGDGAGQFTRSAPGGVAFTTCSCKVGGVGNPGDQVTLKISYPPATPPQYPGGFTKFTFQDGTGALSGLRGEGTLDFATNPQVSFTYHFVH
jgi:hypothetical protein